MVCYAESKEGVHWTKLELGLIEFEGSKKNNIIWDSIGSHCFTPFKDPNPHSRPDERYQALSGRAVLSGIAASAFGQNTRPGWFMCFSGQRSTFASRRGFFLQPGFGLQGLPPQDLTRLSRC